MTESVLRHEIAQEQGYVTMLYEVLDRARDRATAETPTGPRRSDDRHRPGSDRTRVLRPDLRGSFRSIDDRRARTVFRPDRLRRRGDVRTSAVSGSSTTTHDPLLIDWRAPVAQPFYRATTEDPMGVFRRRHIRLTGRTVVAVDDDILDLAALDDQDHAEPDRRGRAVRLAVGRPHRPDVGDRRHDPGGAGRDHPRRPARGPGGPGWPRHRQDRRRPAPRRVPALHPPRPARPARGAGGRPERDLPALHRAGAALARRDRGGAVHHRPAAPRGGRDRGRVPGGEPDQGPPARWSRSSPAPSGPRGGSGPAGRHARAPAHPALVVPGATRRRRAGTLRDRARRAVPPAGRVPGPGPTWRCSTRRPSCSATPRR